jgi:hypothetical protein
MLPRQELFTEFRKPVSDHLVPVANELDLDAVEERVFSAEIHAYTVEEVAHHRHLSPRDVQRIVDSIDNVTQELPDLDELRKLIGTGSNR